VFDAATSLLEAAHEAAHEPAATNGTVEPPRTAAVELPRDADVELRSGAAVAPTAAMDAAVVAPAPTLVAMPPAPAAPPTAPRPELGAWRPDVTVRDVRPTPTHGVRQRTLFLALVVGVGVGLWLRDAQRRETARRNELARAAEQLVAAEEQRAALASKLSATARELAATRAAFEKRVATPPPPPAVVEETHVPPDAENGGVRYADDRLSVHVTAMALDALVLEIGRQAGAVVRGRTPERTVSAQFDDVPLPEALERILGTPSFSLVYDEQRRLKILDLLGPSDTPPPAGDAPAAAPLPDPVRSAEAALPLLDAHPPIALAGALARWFKTETLSLRELIQTGFTHEDAGVRREALRTSISALENDPALAGLLADLARIDEATLESLARRVAGDHAEEVLLQVRTQARRGDVRSKAGSVLERFRTEPGARG
jgi:hypothetical protein